VVIASLRLNRNSKWGGNTHFFAPMIGQRSKPEYAPANAGKAIAALQAFPVCVKGRLEGVNAHLN
jgi:hypothetical protein